MRERLGILNDLGIIKFKEYLQALREGGLIDRPIDLLTDPDTSEPFDREAEVEQRNFADRLEAAKYLNKVLVNATRADIDRNSGLWSWLALFYFEQLCPSGQDGTRRPRGDWYYIPSDSFRNYYRHKLAGPFKIYETHNEEALVLLKGPLAHPGDFNEQLASRQEFITNEGIVQAVDMLYFDSARNGHKRGAAPNKRRPGTLRRFIDVIQQLDLTYDLYAMSAEQILELLPAEFDVFKPSKD